MVTISVSNDIIYNLANATGVVGQQPYKKETKLDSIGSWTLTDTLDGLKEFTFNVASGEHEKSNILIERNISVPFLTPFNGIIIEKQPSKDTIEFKAVEDAWHFERKKYKCHDKRRIRYTKKNWYNKLWRFRRKITIPGKKFHDLSTGLDLFNFPMLFHTIDEELKTHARTDGFDILFTKTETDGTVIQLHHEIENYNYNTGELWAWVEFPEIRSGQDEEFEMYFGNENSTNQQNVAGTWDDYLGGFGAIIHLNNNSLDSTSNDIDGTDTTITYVQSNIANGAEFDGTNSKIDFASDASIDDIFAATDGGLITAWIRPYSDGEGDAGIIADKVAWTLNYEDEHAGFGKIRFTHTFAGTDGVWVTTDRVVRIQDFSKIGVYYNNASTSNDPVLLINGKEYTVANGLLTESSTPTSTADSDAASNLILGNNIGQTAAFHGVIDNFKIKKSPPSNIAELVKVSHADEKDPDNFVIIGQAEEYVQQADIIAESIIRSANRNMPIINTTPIPGLISLWRLDGDTLDSKSTNNGTWTGNELYVKGFFNTELSEKCAKFDGSSYITTTNTPFAFTKDTAFSFQLKVKTTSTTASTLISKRLNDSAANAGYLLGMTTGGLPFVEFSNGTSEWIVTSNVPINDGNWHTIGFTYDGSSNQSGMKLYHDSKIDSIGNASTITGTITSSDNLTFGAGSAGAQAFTGEIDDVRFYSKECTAKEMERLGKMTQSDTDIVQSIIQWKLGDGHVTTIPNLISLWKFDQAVTDAKGLGDAVIVGNEKYTDGIYTSKAFDFDGATYLLTTQANVNFERTDSFSFVLWFKFTSTAEMMLLRRCNAEVLDPTYFVAAQNGKISFNLRNVTATNHLKVETNDTFNDGEWHHLTITYPGTSTASDVKIYVDNVLEDVTEVYDTLTSNIAGDNVLTIGAVDNGTLFFTGQQDDIRVYGDVLTDLEVKRLYEATDSGIDRVRDDNIPTRLLEIEFNHKDHLECLRKIAKELSINIYFDSTEHRVFLRPKGKKISPVFDRAEITEPKFTLNNVANIVNILGAETDGQQKEKTFSDTNDLKYDYEETFTDTQISTDQTLDLVGNNIVNQLKKLEPDLTIETTVEQYNRFDIQTGDTLNISELKQDLQGVFRIIKITLTQNKATLSLNRNTQTTILTTGQDIGSILSGIVNKIQDISIKPS